MIGLRGPVTVVFAVLGLYFCLVTALRAAWWMLSAPGSNSIALLPVAVSFMFLASHRSLALRLTARAVGGGGESARTLLGRAAFLCAGAFLVLESVADLAMHFAQPTVWEPQLDDGGQGGSVVWAGVLEPAVGLALGALLLVGAPRFRFLERRAQVEGSA